MIIVTYLAIDSTEETEKEFATKAEVNTFLASMDDLLQWHDVSIPDCYCATHGMWEADGGPCAECERLGQRELDLCKRVHPAINNDFVRYYAASGPCRAAWSNHRHYKLREIAWNTWQLGKDQALLEAMIRGYSLCIAKPVIDEIHDRMDRDYEEHCRLEALGCRDDIEDCGNHTFSATF